MEIIPTVDKRLLAISHCTDTLAYIRKHYGMTDDELQKFGYFKFGIDLGELDTLTELHRLLFEETE